VSQSEHGGVSNTVWSRSGVAAFRCQKTTAKSGPFFDKKRATATNKKPGILLCFEITLTLIPKFDMHRFK
jgi:hypothetical protein